MNIIVAVDGSQHSQWALEWVAQLPFATQFTVTAVHVIDIVSLRAPVTPHPVVVWNEAFIQAERERLTAEGQVIVRRTEALLKELHLKGKVVTAEGPVSPTLLKYARKKPSLIVMGSRGLSALDRFMLGSVSTRVVHEATTPVLIVNDAPRRLRRILLATDGSRAAAKAQHTLTRLFLPLATHEDAPASPVEVAVMHVMPFLRYPELKSAGAEIVAHAAERLQKAGFAVRELPKIGHPADVILAEAEQMKADLIVSGARGLGAVKRLLLGSVSTKILHHSPCSVLIVH